MAQRVLYERPMYPATHGDQFELDTDSWDYHYHKILCGLEGSDEEKEAIIRKRILRYFGEFKLDAQSYFSIRNDIDYSTPGLQILSTKLVMYGIDYMTIQRARNYFQGFITNIRRMDDSHFLIEFRSENECLAAINKCQKSSQILNSSQEMFKNSQNGWIEMKPYHQFIFERKLMARHCTTLDRIDNICVSTKKSCTFAYNQAKRRFMKNLKQDIEKRERNRESGRGRFNYRNDSNQKNLNNRQRSRSRQKGNFCPQNNACQCQRRSLKMEGCICNRNRKYQISRSRSRSSSCERVYLKSQRRMDEEEKIKQADFKFNLYLKRREQKRSEANSSFNVKSLFRSDPFFKPSIQQIGKSQRSASTNNEDCDIEIVEKQNVIENQMRPQSANNNTEIEFEKFLEKLKLDDSKNDYSAFDLDELDI